MTAVIVQQPKVTAQIVVEETTTQVVVTPKTTLELTLAGTQGPAGIQGPTGPVGPPGPSSNPEGTDGQVQYNNGGSFGGASSLYYDDVNNRVGIGTSSPTEKFHLSGGVARIQNNSSNWLDINANAGTGNEVYLSNRFNSIVLEANSGAADPYIGFNVAGSRRMVIDNNGYVGIGTSVPDQRLTVNGYVSINNGGLFVRSSTTEASRLLDVRSIYGTTILNNNVLSFAYGYSPTQINATLLSEGFDNISQRRGTNSQTFNIYNTYTDASNYERGVLGWNSNVLEIGSEASGTGIARNINLVGGKVGINKSSALYQLDIGGSSTMIRLTSTNTNAYLRMDTTATTSALFGTENGRLVLYPNSTAGETLSITATGNVGIKNSSPSVDLDVTGTIRASTQVLSNVVKNSTSARFMLSGASTTLYVGGSAGGAQYTNIVLDNSGTVTSGDLLPKADSTYTLGSSTAGWSEAWADQGKFGAGAYVHLSNGGFPSVRSSTNGLYIGANYTHAAYLQVAGEYLYNMDDISILSWADSGNGAHQPGTTKIWSPGTNIVGFGKDSAGPHKLQIYNTYTDASNYELGWVGWDGNTFRIGPIASGTGTIRPVIIRLGSQIHTFTTAGNVEFAKYIQVADGSGIAPSITGNTSTTSGWAFIGAEINYVRASSPMFRFSFEETRHTLNGKYNWSGTASANGTPDTGLARYSAGVVKITDGSTGTGDLIAGTLTIGNLIAQDIETTGQDVHLNADDTGSVYIHSGSQGAGAGLYLAGAGDLSTAAAAIDYNGISIRQPNYLGWTSGSAINSSNDLYLYRDAANALAQRNSTSPQAFNIYNTYTDASNYERGFLKWAGNYLELGTERDGTGVNRSLKLTPIDGNIWFGSVGAVGVRFSTTFGLASNATIKWSNAANNFYSSTLDTGIIRDSAAVVKITDGSTGLGDLISRRLTLSGSGAFLELPVDKPIYWLANSFLRSTGPGVFSFENNTSANFFTLVAESSHNLSLRNSTNAQVFNIYNTYTDASNYERAYLKWNSNRLEIGTEALGTGSQRGLDIISSLTRIRGDNPQTLTVGNHVASSTNGLVRIAPDAYYHANAPILEVAGPRLTSSNPDILRLRTMVNGTLLYKVGYYGQIDSTPADLTSSSTDDYGIQLAQTLNATTANPGAEYRALKINVTETDTTGWDDVYLLDAQVGGVSKTHVTNSGETRVFLLGGLDSSGNSTYTVSTRAIKNYQGLFAGGTTGLWGVTNGADWAVRSTGAFAWSATTDASSVVDTKLYRDAAHTIAQRFTTNPQEFRIYNTYTDASNYERASLKWNSNIFEIASEAAGTGTQREIKLNYTTTIDGGNRTNNYALTLENCGAGTGGMLISRTTGAFVAICEALDQQQVTFVDTANRALRYRQRGSGGVGAGTYPAHQFINDATSAGAYPAVMGVKSAASGTDLFHAQDASNNVVFSVAYNGDVTFTSGIYAGGSLGTAGQVLTSNGTTVSWQDSAGEFTALTDTPANYTGHAGKLVQVNTAQTGLEFTDQIDLDELVFDATTAPTTVLADSVPMYLTATGISPNREIELKIKTQDGDEIIMASFIV